MKTELSKISKDLEQGIITDNEARTLLLGLLGVIGRFYTDKEVEKIKYLSFLEGTVDGDTGEE